MTFDDFYIFKGLLGSGAFGLVVKAVNKETNEECAVKVSYSNCSDHKLRSAQQRRR